MPTHISLSNDTGKDITVKTTVDPGLGSSYWSNENNQVKAVNSPTELLVFNRNQGIKWKKSWLFNTQFVVDGVEVVLEELITGDFAFGSDMLQRMAAGGADTLFQKTGNAITISFKGTSGATYTLSWELKLNSSLFCDIHYTVRVAEPVYKKITPVMPQIETVVFLMLENRSLDNVLGWLYDGDKPTVVYPPNSSEYYNGIQSTAENFVGTTSYKPAKGTEHFFEPCRVPMFDPNEPMKHVKFQLYANGDGIMPKSKTPNSSDFWKDAPKMKGFAWDYHASYDNPAQVMGAYNKHQLPVLYGLAENFAVSDAWFCSAPTQTDPNRAFSICGTSLGAEDNSEIDKSTYAENNTLFNALGDNGKSWGMYWQSEDFLGTGEPFLSHKPFSSYYFPQMTHAKNGMIKPYKDFFSLLDSGKLPNFCFLEPFWGGGKGHAGGAGFTGIQGNDYHPPAFIGPAEYDLNELYKKLTTSKQWSKMLFVITFDEHGGTYDHVPPPETVAPDENVGGTGFDFTRMGVRVPTILVSPYIQQSTVFRAPAKSKYAFDHTSFIATFLKWAGVDPASANLGDRVAVAPTFEDVLAQQPRPDVPNFSVPASYQKQGGGTGLHPGLLPVELKGGKVDWHELRLALDETESPQEFTEKLRSIVDMHNKD